jgi:hypothetical protein
MGHGQGLKVGLSAEGRGSDVRNPDLDRTQTLLAQTVPVLTHLDP